MAGVLGGLGDDVEQDAPRRPPGPRRKPRGLGKLLRDVEGREAPEDLFGSLCRLPVTVEEALEALRLPPMSEDELAWMHRVGRAVSGK